MLTTIPGQTIQEILSSTRTIAVVGASPKDKRPSNQVARYLLEAGYHVIPVNPGQTEILGLPCHPDLKAIPEPVDLVDIFRKAADIMPVVLEAIEINAKTIWMQQGIVNEQAAAVARAAGLTVIMDRCIKSDHMFWGIGAGRKA